MTDARREAEEALRRVLANAATIVRLSWSDGATAADRRNLERIKSAAADIAQDHKILRALLAAGPGAKAPGYDRIAELESLLRECNAVCLCGCPESEHESYGEDGESCGDEKHECIRVAPAVLEIVQRYRVALSDALRAQTTPPPSDAVREAAERLRQLLRPPVTMTPDGYAFFRVEDVETVLRALAAPPSTVTVPDDAAVREAAAPTTYCPDCSVQGTTAGCWTLRLCDQHRIDVSFVSLTPPPAGAEVREAAEVVRTILTAHDARLSESGVLTYGPPSKGTGFVAAIQWLRRYDAARGGE